MNEQLLQYIKQEIKKEVPIPTIKTVLLNNDWDESVVDEAFSSLGTLEQKSSEVFDKNAEEPGYVLTMETNKKQESFKREGLTMDKIIEKFIPITGAIFLIIGLGYLIYANAWVNLPVEIRLGLGFFTSIVIIGGSFSLPEKMRYFTDIGIGSGVLMLYATLIYGSRATELVNAIIPEMATLVTATLFTITVSYFASKRNSKVILILGMIGAYITPFVIGQNAVWVHNISFNAYLIYFFAINVSVFLIGREISVRDIIPLNIIGLFIGISTLWNLSSSDGINTIHAENFFTSELFTAVLFLILVIFSIWSILLSAKRFSEKDDGYLSLGYIAPLIWFIFNIESLKSLSDINVGILYTLIAVSCFVGWHVLLGTKTRFQHTALYAAGLLSTVIAFFTFFQEMNVYTSMFIAYASLIFATLYILDPGKSERFISYGIISLMGSVLSIHHITDANLAYETLLIVVALMPAMGAYYIARQGGRKEFIPFARFYSFFALIVALMFVLREFLEYIDMNFLLFYLVPLATLCYLAFININSDNKMSHDSQSNILRFVLVWFAIGFFSVFLYLVSSIYPAPENTFIFTHTDKPIDWTLYKSIFATAILFVGLLISRRLQTEQVIKRPSFILVIFGFSTLLLTGNYIIYAIMNDLQVGMAQGGPRAIATTVWWVSIAIFMLYKGIKLNSKKYHAEKLLGLILLTLSVGKVILYDIATMGMQNKIIILMLIGGAMLLFSYVVRSKDMLNLPENEDD